MLCVTSTSLILLEFVSPQAVSTKDKPRISINPAIKLAIFFIKPPFDYKNFIPKSKILLNLKIFLKKLLKNYIFRGRIVAKKRENFMLLFVDLLTRLAMPNVITGLILAALGLAITFLARKIARVIRKEKEIPNNDNVYLICKALGLVMICVALIVMIIQ